MTDAEKNAAWDEQFYGSLGEFDKRLSKEQSEIEKQRSAAAANGSGGSGTQGTGAGSGAGGGSGMPQEVAGGDTGAAGSAGTAGQAPEGPNGGAGSANTGPKFPPPEGTPSGADDDVVARQLREAAESEKDPALRERLWQEYRKYKSRK